MEIMLSILSVVATTLLAGNVYFVRRLVDKIDHTSKANESTSAQVAQVSQGLNGLGNQLREIKSDIKDLRRIEIEVAVLKSKLNEN